MRSRASLAPLSVRKVCQLTGERDRARGTLAFNQTETNFGFFGTDLGSSFEHGGRLWFLFGDTWPGPGPATDSDCVAWTMDTNPEPGIHLHFVTGAPKKYKSPVLRDRNGSFLKTAGFEVPIAGVSAGGRMYVFYSTDAFEERGGDGGLDAFWFGADGSVGTAWANPTVDSGNWHPPFPATPPGAARAGSRIAAVTRFEDALDIFWIGLDGAVGTTWANPRNDDAKWHPPFPATPPGAARAGSRIAAVTRFEDALDIFWIGLDGAVGTTWANPRNDDAKWHPPFPITPPGATRADSPLAAVTRLDGALDAFWMGPDGAVDTTWANPRVDGAKWHPPFPITPPGAARPGSPLAAVTRLDGALDAFWIGPDGAVGTTWASPRIDGARWHAAFPITPPGAARPGSPLAAVTRLDGALDVFWIGPDGAVGTTWANPRVDGAKWHPPFPITPPGAARPGSPLAAVTRLDGALDVFWIGPDGAVGTTWANPQVDGGRWHPPFPITPPGATRADSPLAAVTRLEGALDVFWIGPDSAVGTTWANPRIDGARWHAPFPISPPGVAGQASSLAALTRRSGGTRVLMGRTVLTSAVNNDPTDLVALYDMSRLDRGGKFINVACAVAPNGVDGLSGAGPFLVAWGSGRYRDSDVFLGAVPLHDIRNPAAWRFFSGSAGVPWVTDQRAAAPLFLHRVVGELSVSWVEPLGLWLMLYNAPMPRGIVGRVAEHPWGPWSDTFLVFDPGWPGLGYGHFMHEKDGSDGVSDPGREHEWGGEYGPYLIDRYTRAVATASQDVRQARIYFVMSTWNPYNTVLMTAIIQREPDG
jgi:hypothetical protein